MARVPTAGNLSGYHEELRRGHGTKESSDRVFGLVFSLVFAVVAFFPLAVGNDPRLWSLGLALALLLISFIRPRILSPLNRAWRRLALFQARLMQPFWMGIIFFLAVTPTALLLRVVKSDNFNLNWNTSAQTYWTTRSEERPDPNTMKKQY